jgi:hypothetical protein
MYGFDSLQNGFDIHKVGYTATAITSVSVRPRTLVQSPNLTDLRMSEYAVQFACPNLKNPSVPFKLPTDWTNPIVLHSVPSD